MSDASEKAYSVESRLNSYITNNPSWTPLIASLGGGDQTIPSTTDTVITGLQASIVAGTYRVRGKIVCKQITAAVAQNISIHGPSVSQMNVVWTYFLSGSGASNAAGLSQALGNMVSAAFAINGIFWLDFDGMITFSADGTFSVQASRGSAGNSFNVIAGSYCDLVQIV